MKSRKKLKLEELKRDSLDEYKHKTKLPLRVVLDNIRSHHNVGSLFRSADAFCVDHIYLCGYTPCPPHREIHKTALGATESVNWSSSTDTLEIISLLKNEGYTIYAIEQTADSILLNNWKIIDEKIALVFGNEVLGVDQAVVDACDAVLEIPQSGTKHSLNISVCAGIVLWDAYQKLLTN